MRVTDQLTLRQTAAKDVGEFLAMLEQAKVLLR